MTPTSIARRPVRAHRAMAVLLIAGLVVAAACGGGDDAAETTPPTTEAPTTVPRTTRVTTTTTTSSTTTSSTTTTTTIPLPVPKMPLTGAPLAEGEQAPDRPALAVKVDNVECAHRTQQGLNNADIVFEEIVEGRLTRFAAVFHSQSANPVGPVRSGRSQDVDLLGAFQRPLMVWSGGNPGTVDFINSSDIINLSYQNRGPGYFRARNCGAPHNLWNDTDSVWPATPPEAGRPVEVFPYVEPGEAVPGDPATFATGQVGLSSVRWDYDEATGLYTRLQGGRAHTLADGTPVSADNVVFLVLEYATTPWERKSPEGISVGSGQVFVFSDGTVQTGTWSRTDRTDPWTLTADDGTPMKLGPGRTFVELPENTDHATAWG